VAGSVGSAVLVLSVSQMATPGERWRAEPVSAS
jgi:hypothetical protein